VGQCSSLFVLSPLTKMSVKNCAGFTTSRHDQGADCDI
jgi:hypothetical protein